MSIKDRLFLCNTCNRNTLKFSSKFNQILASKRSIFFLIEESQYKLTVN